MKHKRNEATEVVALALHQISAAFAASAALLMVLLMSDGPMTKSRSTGLEVGPPGVSSRGRNRRVAAEGETGGKGRGRKRSRGREGTGSQKERGKKGRQRGKK